MKEIYKKCNFRKSMIMTMHDNFTLCYICNKELGKDKVSDHCHLSDKLRGAAHDVCKVQGSQG